MKTSLRFLLALFMVVAPSLVSAVTINVGDNWQTVVNANPAGTTYSIAPGIHRLQKVTPKAGDNFIGQAGAIMNGSVILTGFTVSGATWYVTGQTETPLQHGTCESGWSRCDYRNDVFIDNAPMKHVASQGAVVPGTFFYDYAADRIYIGDNPSGKTVETSRTDHAFFATANDVTIDGLIIEKYANSAQEGAIVPGFGAEPLNWIVQNNELRLNHGPGTNMDNGWIVQNNNIHHNGQLGIHCDDCNGGQVLNNEIAFNNFAHFDAGFEAGGTKWLDTDGLMVQGNYSHDNLGPGLWTDARNINITYDGNLVENNIATAGIWHEISCNAVIKNNIVKGNQPSFVTGGMYDTQIFISSSSDTEVFNNYVQTVGVASGITMVQQDRESEKPCSVGITVRNQVHDNSIYMVNANGKNGGEAQVNNAAMWSGTNLFNNNAYCVDSVTTGHWAWQDNTSRSFASFQSVGEEATGAAYILSNPLCTQMLAEQGLPGKRPLGAAQTPYGGTARAIPGTIQVEDYDNGGEGVAYHDTDTTNSGGAYRTDGVDIKTSSDSPASPAIGFTVAGEWTEYTVNVTAAAVYRMDARVASNTTGKSIHVEMDGVDITGAMAVPNTGPFDTAWATITKTGISLTAGAHIMRVFIDSDPLDLNFLTFSSNGPSYWKFDETTGASAADSSGSSTGTLAGSPVWVGGKIDNALSFDGIDDVMTFSGIVVPTTFTFSAWIFPVPSSDNHGALFVSAASDSGIFYNGNTRKISFYYSGADHLSTSAITENLWRHVAVVSTAGAVTFYIDGIANGTATGAPGFTAAYMGSDSTSENFHGVIDDAHYYNSALSATEVRAVYDQILPVELMPPRALRIR